MSASRTRKSTTTKNAAKREAELRQWQNAVESFTSFLAKFPTHTNAEMARRQLALAQENIAQLEGRA